MGQEKRFAVGLVLLMLTSYLLAVVPSVDVLEQNAAQQRTGTHQDQAFTDGSTLLSGTVGAPINPSIPVAFGYSMTSGSVELSLAGSKVTHTDTYSVASGLLNGSFNDTVSDGSSIQLMSAMAGPPQAGTNSSTVLSPTNLAGTHAYDTLELLCGIASCGRIVATGDLTLYVNTLRVEQGTSILANDLATGGLGAGGSTTTSSSGRNDGGGGAGHGGSGGAGGGTNGGSAGSTYGNGTERGSQGGTVSSSYHATANGGNGGGYLRIFANQIFVNGSIHANGGDGDAGSQASSGTGAGGSGGGGGSGGSIMIQANTVSVGNGGQIKADGGDGGDGANGAQNGPGFGMYDGGDGGGGGGGGRIVINTQANGYSNSGTVNAVGGSGGSKGLKYGTGVDGIDGSGGSNGVVTTGTWNGYVASGNTTSDNGTFTSTMLQTQTAQPSPAYITHNAAVPADASLTVAYRYTLNGTQTSEDEWSEWQPLSLSGEWVPRHQWLQLEYTFRRTGSASPELIDFTIEHTSWTTLNGADVRYDGQVLQPILSNTVVGLTSTFNGSGAAQQPQLTLHAPVGATFSDDLHVWMQWVDSSTPITFEEATIGAVVVNATTQNHSDAGIDLTVAKANLNNLQPSSTWTDADGIEWHAIVIDFTLSDSTDVWFGHLHVPWSFSAVVDVKDTINAVILSECGSYYTFTAATCFGPATSHRFSTAGTTQPNGAPGFTFTLDQPNFAWEDSYAPQLTSLQHRQGLEQFPDLRVNETFSIVLFDVAGEDDLVVEYLGTNWEASQGFGAAQTMTYHNALQGYYLYLNTDGLETDLQHDYNMTFRVMDANGNELLPRPTYNITVYPVAPEVASVSVTGPTLLDPGMPGSPSLWGVSGAMMTFSVQDAHHRETLAVTAELTKSGSTQPALLPLPWNPEQQAYVMDWLPMRSDLGDWDVEISMAELGYPSASDDDGWKEGVDLQLRLVDGQGPFVENVSFPSTIEQGDAFSVNIDWFGDEDESYLGSIAVLQNGEEIANMTILETTQRNAAVLFDTTTWMPELYEVAIHLEDDAGNAAVVNPEAQMGFEVLKPWLDWNLSLAVDNINDVRIVGDVESRSGTAVLSIMQVGGTWNATQPLLDGQVDLTFEMNEFLTPSSNFTVQLCDENDNSNDHCESWTETLSFEEAFAIDVGAVCTLFEINETSLESQSLLSCSLANRGRTPITARLAIDVSENITTEAITVAPGDQGTVVLTMVSGTVGVNETVAWTMLVTNNADSQKVMEMGQVDALRIIEESTNTQGEETVAGEEGNSLMLGVLLLLVGLSLGGLFFYRTTTSAGNDLKEVSTEVEEQFAQATTWDTNETTEAIETTETPQAAPLTTGGPEPHTAPTSVDANGYEWYSTAEGHWYRQAGSQGEWIPYQ